MTSLKLYVVNNPELENFIIIAICLALLIGFVWAFASGIISERKKNKKTLEEMELPLTEIPLFECKATVVEKFCQKENKGSVRFPDTQECCYVLLKTTDGKLHKYGVTLEEYCSIEENQNVTVAFENDKIFGINFDLN